VAQYREIVGSAPRLIAVYLPAHFEESRTEVLHRLIAEHPLGAVVTLGLDGLTANHIPLLLDASAGPNGTLIGHVARKNELWHGHDDRMEALVIFQGASAYISPNWYATKQATHEVVPTYNYVVVHAHGSLVVHEDPKWLRGVVGKLTKRMESSQDVPWKMADAPAGFISNQLESIVGIEIPINRLVGKWKTSQNRPVADRIGAAAGLRASGNPGDAEMAELVAPRE
jgi:transcriptional regulator